MGARMWYSGRGDRSFVGHHDAVSADTRRLYRGARGKSRLGRLCQTSKPPGHDATVAEPRIPRRQPCGVSKPAAHGGLVAPVVRAEGPKDCNQTRPGPVSAARKRPSPPKSAFLIPGMVVMSSGRPASHNCHRMLFLVVVGFHSLSRSSRTPFLSFPSTTTLAHASFFLHIAHTAPPEAYEPVSRAHVTAALLQHDTVLLQQTQRRCDRLMETGAHRRGGACADRTAAQ